MVGTARARGIMAATSRSQRTTRPVKKRPAKKRASDLAVRKGRKRAAKTRVAKISSKGKVYVDYKDVESLKKMLSINGKILSRKRTGASAAEQRMITDAIKRARFLGMLPYVGSGAI